MPLVKLSDLGCIYNKGDNAARVNEIDVRPTLPVCVRDHEGYLWSKGWCRAVASLPLFKHGFCPYAAGKEPAFIPNDVGLLFAVFYQYR